MHPTVDCTASRGENGITVLISNYNVPRSQIDAADICFTLKGTSKISSASLLRIDETHANAKRAWVEMGNPTYLNREQIEALKKASEMVPEPVTWTADEDGIKFDVRIEPLSAIGVSIVL